MAKFYVSTDSTADIYKEEISKLDVFYLPLNITYTKNGVTEMASDAFNCYEDYVAFYNKLREGYEVKTSMNNNYIHEEFFKSIARSGVKDLIHFTISSGLARTVEVATQAIEEVKKEYPDFNCIVIDPLTTTIGQGLLVRLACKMRDEGRTLEETAKYCNDIKLNIQHCVLMSNLDYLKAGGRISGFAATIGKIAKLTIMIDFDAQGKLAIRSKAMGGLKKGISNIIKAGVGMHEISERPNLIVGHTDNLEGATILAKELNKVTGITPEIRIIGPTIGAHLGPDAVAYIYISKDKRK